MSIASGGNAPLTYHWEFGDGGSDNDPDPDLSGPGSHGTSVAECNRTRWEDWYATIERALLQMREERKSKRKSGEK